MRQDKRKRALAAYKGFAGSQTISHVERNLKNGFPTAQEDLTGVQYGKTMNVANMSYQDGKNSALPKGLSMTDNCIYINATETLIPVSILGKIVATKSTVKTRVDCTGSAKHYYNYSTVYYSGNDKPIMDRLEAYDADVNNTETYYIDTQYKTVYRLDCAENC